MKYDYLFPHIKEQCLVFDLETWAEYSNGQEISINAQHDLYLERATVKWFGAYSYKHNRLYLLRTDRDAQIIRGLLNEHEILIGFNNEEFDYPILKNNGLVDQQKYYTQVDCMQILGKSTFKNRSGYAYKNRGELMGYKFKNNSLRIIAEEMKLEFQKKEIDYHIFKQNNWTPEEEKEIKKYLTDDVLGTKQAFEKLWDFWKPFTEFLDIKYVKDLSWIRNSIASLTYKSACTLMNIEPTYSEKYSEIEEMGGRVIMPKMEEAKGIWYVDFQSLYPHIMCMFNLLAETSREGKYVWTGNDVFKVRGKYDIVKPHILNSQIQYMLKKRIELKQTDKDNPMIYAMKIWLNALYGIIRSSIFEKLHTPNCGWDTCWLGQQIQELTEKMMDEFGFNTIYGDTDSVFLQPKENKYNNREYVIECLQKVVNKIQENAPFKVETFSINIEHYLDYIMFPFSEQSIQDKEGNNIKKGNRLVKERKGRKKNYLYITEKEGKKIVELVGLPIKKGNATALGMKIFTEVLEPEILKNMSAKFSESFIEDTINSYLKKDGIMKLISQEYKVKPFNTYKKESQIQAQISKEYFDGNSGIINLIKNHKIGKVGKATLYCTIEEALENNLTSKDLDLTKLRNELEPFIKTSIVESKHNPIKKDNLPSSDTNEKSKELDITCKFRKMAFKKPTIF